MTQLRFYLSRVPLNRYGEDSKGRYWGLDAPLYIFAREDNGPCGYLRAADRNAAKSKVREDHPDALFFR